MAVERSGLWAPEVSQYLYRRVFKFYYLFKVDRPSIFVGTPSIFESLILIKLIFTVKPIITHVLHIG